MSVARAAAAAAALLVLLPIRTVGAQDVRIRELILGDAATPARLVGYGLAVGLDGTGDRGAGGQSSGQTVQSVANLLRRFDVNVPAELLRTRNVAAVLVTAEVSPYLRAGGRFAVHVSSIGDARSLKGGVLWMTPLVTDAGGQPVATAQGALLISEGTAARGRRGYSVETTARIPSGGVIEGELPHPEFASTSRLLLREPDLGTATRIAAAVDSALGAGSARVEDPGSVALVLRDSGTARAAVLARVADLRVRPDRRSLVVIDGRDGTIVAGGDVTVGEALVTHGGITLAIGGEGAAPAAPAPADGAPGAATPEAVRIEPGASVQQIAAALHAVRTEPAEIAAIFESLQRVGAVAAEVIVR